MGLPMSRKRPRPSNVRQQQLQPKQRSLSVLLLAIHFVVFSSALSTIGKQTVLQPPSSDDRVEPFSSFSVDASAPPILQFVSDQDIMKNLVDARSTKEVDQALQVARRQQQLQQQGVHSSRSVLPIGSFNVTTTALRSIVHIHVAERRHKKIQNDMNQIRKQMIVELLETIGSQLVLSKKANSMGTLGTYALCDTLQAVSMLSTQRTAEMKPLAKVVCDLLANKEKPELYQVGPIRLVQCLQAMAKLRLVEEHELTALILTRLLKPDAIGRLPARFLSHGLAALSVIETPGHEVQVLTRSFVRRLRKEKVREEASDQELHRAIMAMVRFRGQDYRDELAVFSFTLLKTILARKNHPFEARAFCELVGAWSSLASDPRRSDSGIESLIELCEEENTLESCSLYQLVGIAESLQHLRSSHQEQLMQRLGERVQHLSEQEECRPNLVNRILRVQVLQHRRRPTVMRPYFEMAAQLFLDDDFLEDCTIECVANFLWFMSMAHWYDEKVLLKLGTRLLDENFIENCTSNLASRIVATYTSILAMGGKKTKDLVSLTSNVFYSYGQHLLTTKLSPTEASSSLYAYAKATYIQDMGIFDHLVSVMAGLTNQASVRQISQSLWSCGKMMVFEAQEVSLDDDDTELKPPPYVDNARTMARALANRSNELSVVDTTQCFWALGRLQISDDDILEPLGQQAIQLGKDMNSVEVSNVLWGLAKIQHSDHQLIRTLSDRLLVLCGEVRIGPQEATTSLYALGQLGVRDMDCFKRLSQVVCDDIDEVNAQAIANTLWAFNTVNIEPPPQLLSGWTMSKLGLVSVVPPKLQVASPEQMIT